jgi:ABC-type oligopeptide transport system substrate-binding subunit
MRKTITLLLLVIAALAGTAAATAGSNRSVTISASHPVVVFGNTVTLSGKVSTPKSGQKVDVLAEASGATSFAALTTVDTTNGGNWTDDVKPTIQTMYQARWQGQTSPTITVKVRPAIKLTFVSKSGRIGTFSVTATAARSFAGKFVLVQRLTSSSPTLVKKVTVDSSSSATFHVRLHRGRSRLRVVMPTSQTSPGYITGFSNVVSVTR